MEKKKKRKNKNEKRKKRGKTVCTETESCYLPNRVLHKRPKILAVET